MHSRLGDKQSSSCIKYWYSGMDTYYLVCYSAQWFNWKEIVGLWVMWLFPMLHNPLLLPSIACIVNTILVTIRMKLICSSGLCFDLYPFVRGHEFYFVWGNLLKITVNICGIAEEELIWLLVCVQQFRGFKVGMVRCSLVSCNMYNFVMILIFGAFIALKSCIVFIIVVSSDDWSLDG